MVCWQAVQSCGRLDSVMRQTTKNMSCFLGASALALLLGGCASGNYSAVGEWDWNPPARLAAGNNGASEAVVVSPGQDAQYYSYGYGQAPEFDRRDAALNIRTNDPYAGWMEFQQVPRPSLYYQGTYYSSRSPDRYNFPMTGGGRAYGGSYGGSYQSSEYSSTYSKTESKVVRRRRVRQSVQY